jgi:hypothetical protein
VLGISKKSVNIAARAEISQYPLDVYIKLQVLKYIARISNKDNNIQLLHLNEIDMRFYGSEYNNIERGEAEFNIVVLCSINTEY